MTKHETMTAEARALHAVLAGPAGEGEAEDILAGFLPGELRELEDACQQLGELAYAARMTQEHEAGQHKGKAHPSGHGYGDPPDYTTEWRNRGVIDRDVYGCPKCQAIATGGSLATSSMDVRDAGTAPASARLTDDELARRGEQEREYIASRREITGPLSTDGSE